MARLAFIALLLTLVLTACKGESNRQTPTATSANPTSSPTAGAASTPVAVPATAPATNISLPLGFSASVIATGFFRPTSLALAEDGSIYVSQRHGNVQRLTDADSDGVFESSKTFAETSGEITGILAAPGNGLYVSATGTLLLVQDTDGDGVSDSSREIVSNLPHGRHQNNGLVLGADGYLYLTNGSTCDDCDEADEHSATILRVSQGGSDLTVFATGLRNPYDLT